jgi:hypothetical protein
MTWVDYIVKAFRNIGGEANYDDLYQQLGRLRGQAASPPR